MVKKINERSMGSYYDRYGWKKDLRSEDDIRQWVEDAFNEIRTDCNLTFYRQDKQHFYNGNVERKFWDNLVNDTVQKIKDLYASEELYDLDVKESRKMKESTVGFVEDYNGHWIYKSDGRYRVNYIPKFNINTYETDYVGMSSDSLEDLKNKIDKAERKYRQDTYSYID